MSRSGKGDHESISTETLNAVGSNTCKTVILIYIVK